MLWRDFMLIYGCQIKMESKLQYFDLPNRPGFSQNWLPPTTSPFPYAEREPGPRRVRFGRSLTPGPAAASSHQAPGRSVLKRRSDPSSTYPAFGAVIASPVRSQSADKVGHRAKADYSTDECAVSDYPAVNRIEIPVYPPPIPQRFSRSTVPTPEEPSSSDSDRAWWAARKENISAKLRHDFCCPKTGTPHLQRRIPDSLLGDSRRHSRMALFANMQSPPGYDVAANGSNNPALMETVRLFKNSKERDWYENMSDLYAVVNSIEQLEKAYIRDCITPKEYTAACSKLLVQVKSAFKLVKSEEFPTIEAFMEKFRFDCPSAMERIREDTPITIRDDKGNTSKCIADIVALFITIMDKLRLNMKAVDELQPEMRDLMDTINRLSMLPADYEGRAAVSRWLHVMSGMTASDQFDDAQIRQMLFDLEGGYSAFLKLLHAG